MVNAFNHQLQVEQYLSALNICTKKGGQVTKPIIVVKIPCKLLYQKIKLSVPQLIHTYLFTMLHIISIVNVITFEA